MVRGYLCDYNSSSSSMLLTAACSVGIVDTLLDWISPELLAKQVDWNDVNVVISVNKWTTGIKQKGPGDTVLCLVLPCAQCFSISLSCSPLSVPLAANYIQSNKPGPHESSRPWQRTNLISQFTPGEQTPERNPISAGHVVDETGRHQEPLANPVVTLCTGSAPADCWPVYQQMLMCHRSRIQSSHCRGRSYVES